MRFQQVDGARLSVIGLGTWQFGSREWGYGAYYAAQEASDITNRALDLGVNLLDTAEVYAFGRSERIVGRAIAGRRSEAFVATKLLPVLPIAQVVERRARGSAARLGVKQIDLYQLHWPNPLVPLAKTMGAMAKLRGEGLIGHVGVSNYSLGRWLEADAALGSPVLSNQVQYSLVKRGAERDLVPWAQSNDRVVIAYSPLAQGLLTGRYDEDNRPGAMRSRATLFLPENLRRARPLLETLKSVAKAHGATPAQVALAWVVRHPNVVAIPGASSVGQLEANVEAADLELSADEASELSSAAEAFVPLKGASALQAKARVSLGRT
jgi:aryl-alcohol dehydrogenase-like predicted oxidoreductase